MSKSAVQVLREARTTLLEKKWTTGTYAKLSNGHDYAEPEDPKAGCFCAAGAIYRAVDGDFSNKSARMALESLTCAARLVYPEVSWIGVPHFNDHPTTTKRKVIKVFDKAIELRESRKYNVLA